MGNRKKRSPEEDAKRSKTVDNQNQGRGYTEDLTHRQLAMKLRKERYEANRMINRDTDRRKREKVQMMTNGKKAQKKTKDRIKNKKASRDKNTIWSTIVNFFGGDKKEEHEKKNKNKVVTPGSRALPSPASNKTQVVNYLTFIQVSHSILNQVKLGQGDKETDRQTDRQTERDKR